MAFPSDIVQVTPRDSQFRPLTPLPVLATLRRVQGGEFDVPASATAWTRDAVEVAWLVRGELVNAWVPAVDVRRGRDAEERLSQIRAQKSGPSDPEVRDGLQTG